MLKGITNPMRRAPKALRTEYARLHAEMLAIVKLDLVCWQLMTAPGVGPLWRTEGSNALPPARSSDRPQPQVS